MTTDQEGLDAVSGRVTCETSPDAVRKASIAQRGTAPCPGKLDEQKRPHHGCGCELRLRPRQAVRRTTPGQLVCRDESMVRRPSRTSLRTSTNRLCRSSH